MHYVFEPSQNKIIIVNFEGKTKSPQCQRESQGATHQLSTQVMTVGWNH